MAFRLSFSSSNSQFPSCKDCIEKKLYKERNCSGNLFDLKPVIRDKDYYIIIDNKFKINYCPNILFAKEDIQFLLSIYAFFERGFLPFEGSILDQPYWVIELFQMLNIIKAELEEKELNSGALQNSIATTSNFSSMR